MKTKKQYIIISLISLVILISIVFLYLSLNKENKKVESFEPKIEVNDLPASVPKGESTIIKTPTEPTLIKKELIVDNKKYIQATLNVFDKSYSIKTEEGSSLYTAMKDIKDTAFSFSGVDHSGLGYFVNRINGVTGGFGKYWIYYVNDKEASVGVSNYILKDGDIISWKQE